METVTTSKAHGGTQGVYRHAAATTGTDMTFAVYVPPHEPGARLPVVWYLSGLTCTHANVMDKGEYRAACAAHKVILVAPDTSPRGEGVADADAWDMGQGAGFYVDATQAPWAPHFAMWSYVTQELPALADVTLARAPWDAPTATPDPRPETAPPRGIKSKRNGVTPEGFIALLRAECLRARAGA